jgi:hypothetical protein
VASAEARRPAPAIAGNGPSEIVQPGSANGLEPNPNLVGIQAARRLHRFRQVPNWAAQRRAAALRVRAAERGGELVCRDGKLTRFVAEGAADWVARDAAGSFLEKRQTRLAAMAAVPQAAAAP